MGIIFRTRNFESEIIATKMKLFSAFLGFLGVQAGKEEVIAQCNAAKTVYPDCACSEVFWKGGKLSRLTFQDNNVGMFMASIPDDAAAWKFRDESHANFNPDYNIFLQFARHKCGVSFVDAVANGDLEFHFMDQVSAYSGTVYTSAVEKFDHPSSAFATGSAPAKKYWTVTVQGSSANTLQSAVQLHNPSKNRGDLPFDAKSGAFSVKKDQVLVFVTGLENVEFSAAQRDACLTSGFVGVMESAGDKDETECMGLAHLYW